MTGRLIHRYNAVSEYSDFISTKPSRGRDEHGNTQRNVHPMDISVSSRKSPGNWYEGVLPPIEDVRSVICRIQSGGNLSQSSVFKTLAPLLVFLAFLTMGMISLQPHTFAHYLLSAPREHKNELSRALVITSCAFILGLAGLRALIWGVAACAEIILDVMEQEPVIRCGTEETIPASTSALMSGILQ